LGFVVRTKEITMTRHRGGAILLILFLVATMAAPVAAATSSGDGVWIVTLEDDHPSTLHAAALMQRHGGTLRHVYSHALNGFSFRGSQQAARNLQRSPLVARVEVDQPVHAASNVVPTGVTRIGAPEAHEAGHTGAGAYIAILDTGIDNTHLALDVAVDLGKNCIDADPTMMDKHGHGTHVAGTASASSGAGFVGVATAATLVPVKVLGDTGSGSWESVICGIDHVTASRTGATPIDVANMSLSGAGTAGADCDSNDTSALRQAVCNSVDAGVVHTVAAGNDAANVANSIPAAYPEVITVSALDPNRCARVGRPPRTECHEGLASFSNYGTGIDVIAPGVGIYSTLPGGSYGTKSGTSMAAPHVAGVVALMRSVNPGLDPAQVLGLLQGTGECPDEAENQASSGACAGQGQWFYDPDGLAEPLINAPRAAAAAGTAPPPSDGPVAAFTHTCEELTCTFTNASTGSGLTSAWTFGDGVTSTETDPTHTYSAPGTYTVTLTVTDSADQTDTASQQVTVSQGPSEPADLTLSVFGYKVRGQQKADLTWNGATSTNVDITRDGSELATVSNNGFYTDNINRVGGGSYTYQVCEQGTTSACSPQVTITF
jgi:subtilisin